MNNLLEFVFSILAKSRMGWSLQTGDSVPEQALRSSDAVEMADVFRSEGKIYVVVAVLVIIFIGLFLYMLRIERKLDKLSKDLNDDK